MKNSKDSFIYKSNKFISYILISTLLVVLLVGCSSSGKKSGVVAGSSILPISSKKTTGNTSNSNEILLTGVFTYLDKINMKMHFVDIDSGSEYEVNYNGGTDIESKYKQPIAVTQMSLGEVYDVTSNKSGKALKIYETSDVWESSGITNFSVDETSKTMTIGASSYKYTNNTIILSNSNKIQPNEIMEQDVVTVRGNGKTVYAVVVDKGHGYVKFTGYHAFLGGFVDIGTKFVLPLSEDMVVTAPEGDFKITMQLGNLQGSKIVNIERDKDITVDFSEYKAEVVKTGTVLFSITPSSAVMYLDGKQVDYSKELQLNYGSHRIVLKANNYTTYTGTFIVNQIYEKKIIDMTATSSSTSSTTSSTGSTSSTSSSTTTDLTAGYVVNINGPEGAAVYVDSIYIGIAPISFQKSAGNKVISFTKAGSATKSYTISIANAAGDLTYSFPEMETESTTSSVTQ